MFGLRKKRRRKIRSLPFPRAWLEILERNVAYYHRLTPEDQAELRRHIQVFLDEKTFEGCGWLEIDDEIRVIIASQACLLLLHRDTDFYPTLRSIVVYPHHYFSTETRRPPGGVMAIKNELGKMAGILSVDGNIDAKTITVEWEAPASMNTIKTKLKEINYPVT